MQNPRKLGLRRRRGWRAPTLAGALGVGLAALLVVQGSSSASAAVVAAAAPTGCSVTTQLVPTCGKTLSGVYARPYSSESRATALRNFESRTGSRTQIVHYYYSGDKSFPPASDRASLRQDGAERLLLANWKVDAGYTWRQVADGKADARIIRQAHYLRDNFPARFYLTIHHEPENEVKQWAGSGFTAADFAAMFRRTVNVLRANGATNIVPVLNLMGSQKWATQSWFKDLYPGDSYVGWLAFAAYATKTFGVQDGYFPEMMNRYWGSGGTIAWRGAYAWATKNHPGKPIMLAEWGIGEKDGNSAWKSNFFKSVPPSMSKYPALKALVYFNNHAAYTARDVRVNTTSTSLGGYGSMLRSLAAVS